MPGKRLDGFSNSNDVDKGTHVRGIGDSGWVAINVAIAGQEAPIELFDND